MFYGAKVQNMKESGVSTILRLYHPVNLVMLNPYFIFWPHIFPIKE